MRLPRWTAVPGLLLGAVLLADVLGRAMGWGALGRGSPDAPRVAVTFDDGPSPRTPELLGVLHEYGVRATFFVTKPACQAYPRELARLQAAGHQVEAHGRWHMHALLLPPWREWAQVRWHPRPTTGPHFYRPPYGGHSPLTRLIARLQDRQIALWDVEGRDWLGQPAATLAAQLEQTAVERDRAGGHPAPTPDMQAEGQAEKPAPSAKTGDDAPRAPAAPPRSARWTTTTR